MRDRIRKFMQPDSDISEVQILSEYLNYLSIQPTRPVDELTQFNTINRIIDANHELAGVISRLLEFNISLHEFMYGYISSNDWQEQILFRAFVMVLRGWFLSSGNNSVDFIEIKELAGNNIEQLFKSVYITCDTSILHRVVEERGLSLSNGDDAKSLANSLYNELNNYLFKP